MIVALYKTMVIQISKLNKSDVKKNLIQYFCTVGTHRGSASMNSCINFAIPLAYAGRIDFARTFMTDEEQEMCECKPKHISFGEMQQLYSIFSEMGTFPQN